MLWDQYDLVPDAGFRGQDLCRHRKRPGLLRALGLWGQCRRNTQPCLEAYSRLSIPEGPVCRAGVLPALGCKESEDHGDGQAGPGCSQCGDRQIPFVCINLRVTTKGTDSIDLLSL